METWKSIRSEIAPRFARLPCRVRWVGVPVHEPHGKVTKIISWIGSNKNAIVAFLNMVGKVVLEATVGSLLLVTCCNENPVEIDVRLGRDSMGFQSKILPF